MTFRRRFHRSRLAEAQPRLVLRFVILVCLGLAVTGVAIAFVVNDTYATQAQRESVGQARSVVATVLSRQLRPSDLAGRVSRGRRSELVRLLSRSAQSGDWLRVDLYDSHGRLIVASNASSTVSAQAAATAAARQAAGGRVVSRVLSTPSGRVLGTFVPVAASGGSGQARALLRFDRDYSPIAAAARRSSLKVAVILEGLLIVLCVLLAPVLSRASARLRRHLAELHQVATHDDVTGLQNRFGFQLELDRQIINLGTLGSDRLGALLLVDLVEFRHINGVLGPEGADELLRQVAGRLRAASEAYEAVAVARLGEDEFGILLRVRDHAEVPDIAAQLQHALGDPFTVSNVRFRVEPRIGAALLPDHGSTREQILRAASAALNAAKNRHQPLTIYEHSHDTADRSRLELPAELREAITSDQLTVHYQPQAEFSTGTVHAAEALARWPHPHRGPIAPDLFIPLAEDTGLITQVDRFVVERAARDWQSLVKQGTPITLAVNLSPIDLLDLDFADRIIEIVDAHQPLARHLIVEITERALLGDYQHIRGSLQRLVGAGARLAIDDFGTGYSSLDRLIHLPIHQIKLDRSIVAQLPGPREHEAITRTTIELAHALDATVVAEGIETREQWDYLKDAGCDIAQGYLIGRPQTAAELAQLLTATADSPVAA